MIRKLSVLALSAAVIFAALPGASSFAQATDVITLNADSITGGAHVVKADIVASNGVIHIIDGVLVPPSILAGDATPAATAAAGAPVAATQAASAATMAATAASPSIADVIAGNPDLSTLLAALKATGLTDMFTKAGTYTVFAPNNAAFDAVLKMLGLTTDQLLAQPDTVREVLAYHVVGKVIMAADLAKLTTVTTIEGEDISISMGPAPVATTAAAGTMAASSAAATTLGVVKNDKLGPILVGPDGKTLYSFKKDTPGVSTCTDKCATSWPPLTIAAGAKPTAAAGVSGKLSTITRADGTLQVTYNDMPLYYFAKDVAAGDTNGQAVGTVWYVVAP